jgi:hypothetical protein
MSVPLPVSSGGTGQSTANAGLNALLPSQSGQSGKFLTTDGTDTSWATAGGGSATLTISNKTGAYTVVAGDLGTIINCTSGTFTVSLTAAATLGAGFNCWIWNTSTTASHAVTIDPAGAETIDGLTTLILRCGEGVQIVCDGTNWQTGSKKAMRAYAENILDSTGRPVVSGANSAVVGANSTASGAQSYIVGNNSTASATQSLALGSAVTASATQSTAIGMNSGATGSQAVTGSGAMALGGSYASGTDSFAAAATNNTSSYGATGANSVAIGRLAIASGSQSIAISSAGATASALGAVAIGGTSGNLGPQATAAQSMAVGSGAVAAIVGKYAYATRILSVAGDAQYGLLVLRVSTTSNAATPLVTNAGAAGVSNQVILPNNSAYAFTGTVVARQQAADGTASAAWKIEGLIRREADAASTTLVASTVTAIDNTPGWTLALSADTTNGGLAITATGAAATDIRWVATVQTSEVTYA